MKNKSPTKGSGQLRERLCGRAVGDSVFPPAPPLGPGEVFSGQFLTKKESLSHARTTNPRNSVCVLPPRRVMMGNTFLVMKRGLSGLSADKQFETCMLTGLCSGVINC